MPKLVRPLSELEIKKAKPKDKQYRLFDGEGMSLLIFPDGRKRWRLDYSFNKKRSSVSLGKYPDITLKEARDKRVEIKQKINDSINPSSKSLSKNKLLENINSNLFKDVALEYFKSREDLSPSYIKDSIQKLEKDIFPYLGDEPMNDIEPLIMLKALKLIDKRGSNVSAKKTFSIVDRIYKYGVMQGYAKRNIMGDLDKKLSFRTIEKKNFAHTTDEVELKKILIATENYSGDYNTKMALTILPYIFVRPANIRFMKWDDINFDTKLWTISADEMKMKKDHMVPLTDTVLNIINEMKDISFSVSKFVFPSRRSYDMALSENTLNFGLKRMGFDVTAHGFRHTFSSIAHENIYIHNFPSEIIELQLAHVDKNTIRATYNKALYMDQRIELMQWWSDFLDNLKKSN
jgi:integrase